MRLCLAYVGEKYEEVTYTFSDTDAWFAKDKKDLGWSLDLKSLLLDPEHRILINRERLNSTETECWKQVGSVYCDL